MLKQLIVCIDLHYLGALHNEMEQQKMETE